MAAATMPRASTSRRGRGMATSRGVEVVTSFEEMGLREEVLRGIFEYGYENPSAIQQRAILPIISGRDIIAQAQSGTGKTSMISLAACQMVDTTVREYVRRPVLIYGMICICLLVFTLLQLGQLIYSNHWSSSVFLMDILCRPQWN